MSDAICPKCHEKIEPFALSLAFFPFYFKCNRCNVRLKLKSLKLITSILSAYVLVVVTMIWLLPAFRAYAVLTSVFVWLVLYNFIAHKMLSKDNLLIVECGKLSTSHIKITIINKCMIKQLNNASPEVGEQIYQVFQSAYKIEAELTGVENFPPLSRTVEHIQQSTTQFYGFIVEDRLAGVIEITLSKGTVESISKTTLEIDSLTVSPLFFKQGIASQLIEFVLQNKVFKYAIVETAAINQPAIKLYEKHGFRVFKQFTPDHGIEKVALKRN